MTKHQRRAVLRPNAQGGYAVGIAPTQIRRPRRTVIRTVFQALVALCAMAPVLVATTGLSPEQLPWLAGVLAIAGIVTRVMALPQVEIFLRKFLPWLAAAPRSPAAPPLDDKAA